MCEVFVTMMGLSGTHEAMPLGAITSDDKKTFVQKFYPIAQKVGAAFGLNPMVILSQASLESGFGTSYMARNIFNFFGFTASGKTNQYWNGESYTSKSSGLKFRVYKSAEDGFSDYARLITTKYKDAAQKGSDIGEYAKAIAYSAYIDGYSNENRELYRTTLIANAQTLSKLLGQAITITNDVVKKAADVTKTAAPVAGGLGLAAGLIALLWWTFSESDSKKTNSKK